VGVDGGTGGIRAGLFEVATGTPIGFADCQYDTEYPQPGRGLLTLVLLTAPLERFCMG